LNFVRVPIGRTSNIEFTNWQLADIHIREFDFVQLQGQDTGLPTLFMQFANHYKEKL